MLQRVEIIFGFALLLGALYLGCMRATPRRGFMRVLERACAGIILCFLCHWLLRPLGITLVQSPLAALSAGYLGLPGVALCAILSGMP